LRVPTSSSSAQYDSRCGRLSRFLARQAGENIPLDTERGYHIEFALDASPIKRPVHPVELGFYITPMQGRLRVAGTVELGGLSAPPSPIALPCSSAAFANFSRTSASVRMRKSARAIAIRSSTILLMPPGHAAAARAQA